ncbi:amidase domain-containing protein [Paenibacillus tengchongensis]|uniref:amidase domain-containing protein n=1 Tax=Paenibacillus tengchongensis TaxID=2608684 RepID=UPI00124D5B8F|nr:amidase domain-containing protein [Paenibacillus tengchongensis]
MFKRVASLLFAVIMVFSMSASVFASEQKFSEDSAALELKSIEAAYDDIKEQIVEDYQSLYQLDHFTYDYDARVEQETKYYDINIYVDMALTRHPSDSPFVKGMEKALHESTDELEAASIQKEIDAYVSEIEELYYNIPYRSTFTYTVLLNDTAGLASRGSTPPYQIYYRTDAVDNVVLTETENLSEVENATESFANGYNSAIESVPAVAGANRLLAASFTYNKIAARDWAYANWNATPEFPSSAVDGTDCANFVSKALNNGGVPQDKTGKWYQASTWGGWPGDHWFRTGYNGINGVVIYMVNKGYFAKQSSVSKVGAGSIMYWNAESHVALVTYGDGVKIMYTQHGASQTKDTVYKSENASFYTPTSSIL